MDERIGKSNRILEIYTRLMAGKVLNKSEIANEYGVDARSIQRDFHVIRNFLGNQITENGFNNELVYDRKEKGYLLKHVNHMKFTNEEVLAISKILLDSRALKKSEMSEVLDKLIECCVPKENQKMVSSMIANEKFHYIELNHKKSVMPAMWKVAQAIRESRYIEIKYKGIQGTQVKTRRLMPIAIMFSEFYFYLAAFIDDEKIRENFDVINDSFPTIYRFDRIKSINVLDEHYKIPYKNRFEEGEFRKRVQLMYGGKLQRTKFNYYGYDVTTVLDKLPTAEIIGEDTFTDEDGKERKFYTIQAETFGKGIEMWLNSQGDLVKKL